MTGVSAMPLRRMPPLRVVLADGGAAGLVVAAGFKVGHQFRGDVVFHRLVVGGHVAAGFAVEVQLADFQRVFADGVGDFLDHAFGGDHALRAAEAPEGRVGDGVGLQRQGLRVDRLVEIGVVAVEQRAVGDRAGEVGGEAAAGGEQEIDALDAAFVVEADDVIDFEVVALAGDDHVVVAVGAQLGGAAGLLRDEGRRGGEQVRLGFLAAEGSAHAPDFDGDGVGGDVQHVGYDVLDLAGVLGRGMDEHFVILAGDRHGDLAFQVEVVLAADGNPAFQAAGSGGDGLGGVAALERHGREHDFAGFPRLAVVRTGSRSSYSATARRAARRAWSRVSAATANRGWPAYSIRSSANSGSSCRPMQLTSLVPGTSARCQHADDAGGGFDLGEVERQQLRVRTVAEAEIDVKQAGGFADVVDIDGLAGDVLVGAVVAAVDMDAAGDALVRREGGRIRHGPELRSPTRRVSASGSVVSTYIFISKFAATVMR